ncbi:MAG: SufD family Fe-S cluster assembly protein [Bacilli bacterium]
MDKEKNLLSKIFSFNGYEKDAHNIRENGKSVSRKSTEWISILSKKDVEGIDVFIKENTDNESVKIPVILTVDGFSDKVYNDFYVGKNAKVTIEAGCGIENDCESTSMHSGIHTFHLEEGSSVNYIEKHYGCGKFSNNKIINTDTIINMKDNCSLNIDTTQLSGVDNALRITKGNVSKNSTLIINEKLLTSNEEMIKTVFNVSLIGENSNAKISSKAVAQNDSIQEFSSNVKGNCKCFAHISCDAIMMDNAKVSSNPKIEALSKDASLSHEAVIGKIAGEQILKLRTLGLSVNEAEEVIIKGFLS